MAAIFMPLNPYLHLYFGRFAPLFMKVLIKYDKLLICIITIDIF